MLHFLVLQLSARTLIVQIVRGSTRTHTYNKHQLKAQIEFSKVLHFIGYTIITILYSFQHVTHNRMSHLRYFNRGSPLPIAKGTGLGERLTRKANLAVASAPEGKMCLKSFFFLFMSTGSMMSEEQSNKIS